MRALTHGAIQQSLYDILTGNAKPEMSADEAEKALLDEFRRLGGGASGD